MDVGEKHEEGEGEGGRGELKGEGKMRRGRGKETLEANIPSTGTCLTASLPPDIFYS